LARLAVGIDADGDVSLVPADVELVGERAALLGQVMATGQRRPVGVAGVNGAVGDGCRPSRPRPGGRAELAFFSRAKVFCRAVLGPPAEGGRGYTGLRCR